MNDTKPSITITPGLGTLLTLLFVGLKLTGHIDWSWWWVLSPLWIGLGLIVVFGAILYALIWASE
jgi:hypothetical protein